MYFSELEVVMEDVFLFGGGAAQPGQGPAQLAVPPRVRRPQEAVGKTSDSVSEVATMQPKPGRMRSVFQRAMELSRTVGE